MMILLNDLNYTLKDKVLYCAGERSGRRLCQYEINLRDAVFELCAIFRQSTNGLQ